MRITFILPDSGHRPVGGYKVVYEYAKRMDAEGHRVRLVYPASLCPPKNTAELVAQVRAMIRRRFTSGFSCAPWFSLPASVREILVPDMRARHIPDADIVFATSWETAEFVAAYPPRKGRKFYLIQSFEDWSGERERVLGTWKANLEKIVIAPWLEEIATSLGETCHLIENGFDFSYFCMSRPIAEKNPRRVAMLYHNKPMKGAKDGLAALKTAKHRVPGLEAALFGVPSRPADLPEWIEYYQTPDRETHNRIYNDAAVFVGPSLVEGFCLTPPEAMMCGCAVACTDIGGYTVVAKDGETALLSPPGNPDALAENIVRLIEDDELRIRIATEGNRRIQEFTWERAYAKMKQVTGC